MVTAIANTAKDATTLEAVTEFEVRIRLINDSYSHLSSKNPRPFRPGMTASVDIITERKSNVLSVPLSSVTTRSNEDKGKPGNGTNGEDAEQGNPANATAEQENKAPVQIDEIVFVHDAATGTVKAQKVKTGISDFDNIEILSGVKAGDKVVSGPFRAVSKTLKDGSKVAAKDEKDITKTAQAASCAAVFSCYSAKKCN